MSKTPGPTNLNVTDLDFQNVRKNLKNFLNNQNEFTDFDFEGSGLAVLVDLLSYEQHYAGYYANMLSNESHLDSAVKRQSVVSKAKELGYHPNSITAPRAKIDITINTSEIRNNIEIPKGTKFSTNIDGESFTFQTLKAYFAEPIGNEQYKAEDVEIVEGRLVSLENAFDDSVENPRFSLLNSSADISTLKVSIKENQDSSVSEVYSLAPNVVNVNSESKVYFIQEDFDEIYSIYFGDDIIGKKPDDGNIITMEYLSTKGSLANKAFEFSVEQNILGFTNISVETKQNAVGGKEREGIETIRRNAPLFYQSQNRAVTENDYRVILSNNVSLAKTPGSIEVWGGEEEEPPVYGKVFISIKPETGDFIAESLKEEIKQDIVKKFNILTIIPEVVDPEFLYIKPTVKFSYDPTKTTRTRDQIKALVDSDIRDFNENTLEFFRKRFFYSFFCGMIDDSEDSIVNNLTDIRIERRFSIDPGVKINKTIRYKNSIEPGTVLSNFFVFLEPETSDNDSYFINDDGKGNVRLVKRFSDFSTTTLDSEYGTVDYEKGIINIPEFKPESVIDDSLIKVSAKPKVNNVFSKNNMILTIDENDISITGQEIS